MGGRVGAEAVAHRTLTRRNDRQSRTDGLFAFANSTGCKMRSNVSRSIVRRAAMIAASSSSASKSVARCSSVLSKRTLRNSTCSRIPAPMLDYMHGSQLRRDRCCADWKR